ncbi:GNAT family N-acetyltransferase [Paenibacillus cymbidii]|uniref:GNAT family N-acetyltransferase n=1 Tax=Paenibacillus cymbidii TaxID=1639034 RepID=UPI001081BB52|nr:GNAT family N-acetyltransferase [Paenibacillus cymbidii]
MIHIETARLRLRDWKEADLAPFCRMNADEEVMRFMLKPLSTEETTAFYLSIRAEHHECGYGRYAVEEKESGAWIGFIGFRRVTFEAEFAPCIEIGWRLQQAAWGQGYATEGAKACLRHGFGQLGFSEVHSFTATVNLPSQNVMNKIGLQRVGLFDHPKVEPGHPLREHVLYRADRDNWLAAFEGGGSR